MTTPTDTAAQPFRLGDHVTWTSQANGSAITKTGEIVSIVPANMPLYTWLRRAGLAGKMYDRTPLDGASGGRVRESYLIAVTTMSPTGKVRPRQKLYWPDVRRLRHAERDE